jgi:hypothetical protein
VTRRYEKGGHGMYNMKKQLGAAPGA